MPSEAGDSLLIVLEDPLRLVRPQMADALADEARTPGASRICCRWPGRSGEGPHVDAASVDQDCIVYLARQRYDRFEASTDNKTRVVSYARDAGMLASAYGTTEHQVFLDLKEAVNDVLLAADRISVTCPLARIYRNRY